MIDPLDPDARQLIRRLHTARRRALLALTAERIAAQAWRCLTWMLLFAGLWLFEIPAYGGPAGNILAFLVFIAGIGFFVYRDLLSIRLPQATEIDRRIELDNSLPHRPLNALQDTLANAEKMDSRSLWFKSRKRALDLRSHIQPVFPRALVPLRDPYALRFAALLFCMLGFLTAGADWKPRLAQGLAPFVFTQDIASRGKDVRLIVTPPECTGLQQMIAEGRRETLEIPTGSMLKITVSGGWGRPSLKIDGEALPFESAGTGNYILELAAPQARRMTISQLLFPRASYAYKLIPDHPPTISQKDKIQTLPDAALRVPLTMQDDYSVTSLHMQMQGADLKNPPAIGKPLTITRSVVSAPHKPLEIQPVYDLASHPWAGMPVKMSFTAQDHLSQKSAPVTVDLILPERNFSNPASQLLISLRKKLIAKPLEDYLTIQEELENLIAHPENFRRDNTTLLSLRSAASRLFWSGPSQETAESVAALLWDTALRVEDGNLSLAARALREAQMELENALRDPDIKPEELALLMQNLRMAMAQYFLELQEEMQERAAEGTPLPFLPPDMFSNIIDPETLAALLQQMEVQMMSGDRNAAQQMLSQLQNMMDMMGPSLGPLPPEIQQMLETGKEMQELIRRQQALLDQTSAQAALQKKTGILLRGFGEPLPENSELMKSWGLQDMPPAPKTNPAPEPVFSTRENQKEQEFLRYTLGQIMMKIGENIGKIPENFGMAEQEMRGSSGALGEDRPDLSVPYQDRALKLLKDGQKQMSQQMAQKIKQMTGISFGGGMRYDPLGRPYRRGDEGLYNGSSVKIPDEAERKQAQEILRLLQKRAGECDRPEQELEYYRRLLRQF